VPIEPWLTEQWYVDAAKLAEPAIASVEEGRTVFVPKQWEKTYFEWMRNIQPWCISRQLWWGHQIPAWYGSDGEIFVEETENLALAAAERHYGSRVMLTRDEDVLDTWFSSALWPFSTLGWPEETPEVKRYYPTDVLVTGFDIIFFWVARMMMMGLHFMHREPFHTVYIHALVRDARGQKMSKSKGNVIDPLDLIADYGADALRFTLAAMAAQGRDLKLDKARVEGYRNFGTKLWNACRFCEMSGVVRHPDFDPVAARLTLNRWIVGEVARTRDAVTSGIEEHRYNEAAAALYGFVWHVFCDWHLEFIKPVLAGDDEAAATETRHVTAWVLDQILLLLHPFMPFLTEELWQRTGGEGQPRDSALIVAPWPDYEGLGDASADAEIGWVIELVSAIRSVRSEMNVPAAARIACVIAGANAETRRRASHWQAEITRLARLENLAFADRVPEGAANIVLGEATVALPLAGVIDLGAERARLEKDLDRTATDIAAINARLGNQGFLAKAPEEVVEEARDRRTNLEARKAKIAEALNRLQAAE
jgi:valyl-tRNA synthetase